MKPTSHQARKQRSAEAKAIRLARARRKRQLKALVVLLLVLALIGGLFAALSLGESKSPGDSNTSPQEQADSPPPTAEPVPAGATAPNPTPCPPTDGSAQRTTNFAAAPPMCIDPAKNYTATFDTTNGKIVVALNSKEMPNTVNNFVVLSRYKYYDGSAIVRTNTGIDIIQGGAPTTQTNADRGPGYTIADEGPKATYSDGDLVMANTGQPNTSGAQWFFGAGPNVSQLDSQGTYLKFGKVTEGLDVVHDILDLHQPGSSGDPSDGAPSEVVLVNSIKINES